MFDKSKVVIGLAFALLLAQPTFAQSGASEEAETTSELTVLEMRAEQVVALLNGEGDPQEIFTQGFLAAVPPAQLAGIVQQLSGQFGAALAVESLEPPGGNRAALEIRMERAIARGGIAIDTADNNKISELLFQSFDPLNDDSEQIETDLSALPGEVSWWFGPTDGTSPALSGGSSEAMPVGSTFKLYVLAALAREVAAGERNWSDTITLSDERSFPSGMMQDWPVNAPVSLHTLASLMISISDNTATDELIRVLGRDVILQTLVDSGHSEPSLNTPFLKTRDMFLLKAGPDERLNAYREGDAAMRGQILDTIDRPALSLDQVRTAFSGAPVALDVEWFASASDLISLFRFMRQTSDPEAFAIMAINPSMAPANRTDWSYVGYKGGSEPGVLNLTWFLTDETGRDHALVLSWANPDTVVDTTALELIAQRILSLPR